MNASPPSEVACGTTTESAAEQAIIASTIEPPRSRMRSPASEASEWPETTMPLVPYTGERETVVPAKLSVFDIVLVTC